MSTSVIARNALTSALRRTPRWRITASNARAIKDSFLSLTGRFFKALHRDLCPRSFLNPAGANSWPSTSRHHDRADKHRSASENARSYSDRRRHVSDRRTPDRTDLATECGTRIISWGRKQTLVPRCDLFRIDVSGLFRALSVR